LYGTLCGIRVHAFDLSLAAFLEERCISRAQRPIPCRTAAVARFQLDFFRYLGKHAYFAFAYRGVTWECGGVLRHAGSSATSTISVNKTWGNISPLYQLDTFDWTILIVYFAILGSARGLRRYRVKQVIDFWRYRKFVPQPKGKFSEAELPRSPFSCRSSTRCTWSSVW
jgi:hypothetical protein